MMRSPEGASDCSPGRSALGKKSDNLTNPAGAQENTYFRGLRPPGTESRLARRLMADTGRRVGEIDLAVEAIRSWEPFAAFRSGRFSGRAQA